MTREIKFRAWVGKHKKMVPDNLLCKDERAWYSLEDMTENIILMQFTNLLDKNGREIYEGDIVFDEDGEYSKICIIQWDDVEARFFGKSVEDDDSYSMQEISGEIIGNIYSDPHLLNDK